jgi:fucose permease
MIWLYFGCIFAYVGSEQGTADWLSRFLSQYHHFDPHTTGANAVSWFWGLMTAGCFVWMILLEAFGRRRVLPGFSIGALIALSAALFGPAAVSLYAFPLVGFFASVMWPTIISLALNSVSEHHVVPPGLVVNLSYERSGSGAEAAESGRGGKASFRVRSPRVEKGCVLPAAWLVGSSIG